MALVRRNVRVPIGACESALTLPQILRVLKLEAADFFNYKISRSGGFFRGKQAVHLIEAAGLFAVGSEQLGFGVELAAQAHFAVSTSSLMLPGGYGAGILGMAGSFDTKNFDGDIVDHTPRIEEGYLILPEGNGLGVELVEEKVERCLTPNQRPILVGRRD
jgi:L-alanine-DL-glutamate epimerase-like enolase superfamily enzyme